MRIKPNQLTAELQKGLAPVYLLSGDEALQLAEVADEIRVTAKQAQYLVRDVLVVDAQFDWRRLLVESANLSIFSEKKIIDLRLPSAKLGNEGSKALLEYCSKPPSDTILLISTAKLAAASLKNKWFQALEKIGVFVQIWPLRTAELVPWLQRRSQKKGMNIELDALKLLAARTEGNLLAAAQEIEKLYILYGNQNISYLAIEQSVADLARFDVFQLVDSLLAGKMQRSIKILNKLKAEGQAASIVLWALSREARLLLQIKSVSQKGPELERVLVQLQVWDKRKQLMLEAAKRLDSNTMENMINLCATADRQIKGDLIGDSWETLLVICRHFCACALPDKFFLDSMPVAAHLTVGNTR